MVSATPILLPVLGVGTTIDVDGVRWPTAVVDASDTPEVADLARVHAIEGIGDIHTVAERVTTNEIDLFLLGVRMSRPVTAAFALAFQLPRHESFLTDVVAKAARLTIATSDPNEATDQRSAPWLSVDLDTESFLDALHHRWPPLG